MALPTGTVTFLRSDIEGSMELVRTLGARYDAANAEHAAIVRVAVEAHAGEVVRTEGDAFFAVFTDAGSAARAAIEVQRAMAAHDWPDGHALRLRIGLHTGVATRAGDDYGGFEVNRAARIAAAGRGGQVICSGTARALIAADPPEGAELLDLGWHRLKGIPEPERLFQLTAPGLERDFEPLRTGHGPYEHLPERKATFVGRERELAELGRLLEGSRLITLLGAGGTGKTTLAVELARRHAGEHADGAWFVDLAGVVDPEAARAQAAHDLGLFDGPAGPAVDRLASYLGDRDLLIIVDNLEQVRGGGELVGELLRISRSSRVIATSRTPLHLSAEQGFPLRPLDLEGGDEGESEAVRLFVERARRVRPDLRVGEADDRAIEAICRLVDGLPLAIELCAARAAVLPVERIEERLRRHLPLPGSGPRDLPARQRTLEDTVAWSFELLDPPLQDLFVRLGVFEGSFELEQAAAVCTTDDATDVLDGLVRLAEQSLLVRLDDEVGGVRFGMLETIRAFSRSRLETTGEAEALRARHARSFLTLAERVMDKHAEPTEVTGLARLEADSDNLEQATRWAIEAGDADMALGLVGYLWRYWVHGGRLALGRALTDAALDMPGADADTEARAWALGAAGSLAYWSNETEQARARYEGELVLAVETGTRRAEADAWFNLMFVRRISGDRAGAEEAAANTRRILGELGDERLIGDFAAHRLLIDVPGALADTGKLPDLERRAAELEPGDTVIASSVVPNMRAVACLLAGDGEGATRNLAVALRIGLKWRRIGDVTSALSFAVAIGAREFGAEAAATIIGALEAAVERYGVSGPGWPRQLAPLVPDDPLAEVSAQLGGERFEQARDLGRHMTLEQVVGFIEELSGGDPGTTNP